MLLLFVTDLPHMSPRNATQLLQDFKQFNASLRPREEGGYLLTVPSGHAPLRTRRALANFCAGRQYQNYLWRLRGVDEDGNPTIPLAEERDL